MTNPNLITKRPISDKLGGCVWPYYDNIEQQVIGAQNIGIKYVSAGALFRREEGFPPNTNEFSTMIDLIKKYDMKLMVDWSGTQSGNDTTTHSFYSTNELNTIKSSAVDMINQLKGLGVIYLGWNEPNGLFWIDDTKAAMTDYDTVKSSTDMEIWLAQQEKALDSSCTVAGTSFLYPPDYVSDNRTYINLINQLGVFDHLDAVAEHPYLVQNYNCGNPEQLLKYDAMKVTNLPKITNEFAFPWKQKSDSSFQGIWTLRDATKLTLRQILMMDYTGYSIIGLYTCECGTSNDSLLNADGSLTEVAKSIRWLLDELDGYTFDTKIEVVDHVGYNDDMYVLKYIKDNSPSKLVYWTPTYMGNTLKLELDNNSYELKFDDYPKVKEID